MSNESSGSGNDPQSVLDASLGPLPHPSALVPVRLTQVSEIKFDCHPGVSCFNECCKRSRVILTPYDVVRLKQRLNMAASEFVVKHTMSIELDAHGLPGLQLLAAEDSTHCIFLGEKGCTVYEDRPTACRYYPLGTGAFHEAEGQGAEDFFFLVKEDHCKGHDEPCKRSVAEYCKSQEVAQYDDYNTPWNRLILKKRSGGPAVGKPSPRSLEFFFMCSYDMEGMHDFIATHSFQEVYDLEPAYLDQVLNDELERLKFSFRLLDQVLYGEKTIAVHPDAAEKRRERARARAASRHLLEVQNAADDLDAAREESELE